jgi:hypothetical protein
VVSEKESALHDAHDGHLRGERGDRADTRPNAGVLDERGADDWMNLLERALLPLKRSLVRAPNDALAASPVAPLVNSVKNDGPELMRAAVE